MNLTNEQIQAILDGAPNDGFNSSAVIMHSLYEEILALRQEVELLKALNNGLKAPTARCSTRFICIVCGKGGGSFLNIRPPQSYSCSHCESKNTMLPKHVHDAVKAQQSEVAARAVESAFELYTHKWSNDEELNKVGIDILRRGVGYIYPAGLLEYARQLREGEDDE